MTKNALANRRRRDNSTNTPPRALPRLLTIEQVADHLGVGVRHVRRLVAERRIPFVKWGHLLRFDPDRISAWLDDREVPPWARPGG